MNCLDQFDFFATCILFKYDNTKRPCLPSFLVIIVLHHSATMTDNFIKRMTFVAFELSTLKIPFKNEKPRGWSTKMDVESSSMAK